MIEAGQLWESHEPAEGHEERSLLLVLSNEEAKGHRGMAYCYCMAGRERGRADLWTLSEGFYRRVA